MKDALDALAGIASIAMFFLSLYGIAVMVSP